MKKLFTIVILFSSLSLWAAEGTKPLNISGSWKGMRYQYNQEKNSYIAEFTYQYDLTQEGNQVSGITLITDKGGNFAKIAVKGFVEGNKFYFEENKVLEAKRAEGYLWCLKKGVLDIKNEGDQISISGATPSFIEYYGYECSGGFTYISQKIEAAPKESEIPALVAVSPEELQHEINVVPNPFVSNTTISFKVNEDSRVALDVVDIAGRSTNVLAEREVKAGTYTLDFTPQSAAANTFYIVQLHIGDKTYTKMIQKSDALNR